MPSRCSGRRRTPVRYAVAGYGVLSCVIGGGMRTRRNGASLAAVRLNKLLSASGACARREADELMAEGRVTINGKPAVLGTQVNDGDDVRLDGDRVGVARKKVKPVYIALNNPVGIT